MITEQSGPMILAIGTLNDFLHVYHDDQELLSDDEIGVGAAEISGPLEFFDSDGYRLAGKYNQQWQLIGLRRTHEPPNPTLVRWRVQKSFDHLRGCLKRSPGKIDLQGLPLEQALQLIPELDDSSDFDKFLKMLVHRSGISTRDPGDLVHNWRHSSGWDH